jgi:hypothetical protein
MGEKSRGADLGGAAFAVHDESCLKHEGRNNRDKNRVMACSGSLQTR